MPASANIPGAPNALPGPFTDVITQGSGATIVGGSRIVAMIGQGSTTETVVSSAQGGGIDGLNATYTSSTGADGRHFQLKNYPLISNRTTVFKNGIPLNGVEGSITATTTFSYMYDYMVDITYGELLLQAAHFVNFGTDGYGNAINYLPVSTNTGQGTINGLQLIDANAPPETWTIRCVSVQRNVLNQPIGGTATFIAVGSVSGSLLDANGNPIVWVANNQVVSNGILKFSISENQVSNIVTSPFVQGDGFTIQVASGVLIRGDSLTSTEIPVANINVPTVTQGMGDVVTFCGYPSLTNNLSLGCQLAYANAASSITVLQAAPPLPRRTSYVLDPIQPGSGVNALSTNPEDFIFPLPIGVIPDINAQIHFFVTSPTTLVETQILPNQFPYYKLGTAGEPTNEEFIFSNLQVPAGYSYSYTVNQSYEELATGFDGYISPVPGSMGVSGVFSSSIVFDNTYFGKILQVIDAQNVANVANYIINGITDTGALSVHLATATYPFADTTIFSDFTDVSGEAFELINPATLTAIDGYSGTDGVIVANIGTGTATFTSSSINFASYPSTWGSELQINGDPLNNGLYTIIGVSGYTLTLQKTIVKESNMHYQVVDPTMLSSYIVVNHNVVPNGNQLRVTIVDHRDAPFYDAGWINALASLETIECDIVVPLPNQTISVIFQNALNHCVTMSNIVNKKERVLFIGAIQGLTPSNLTGATLAAVESIGILEGIQGATVTDVLDGNISDLANYSVSAAYGETYRCVYFYPDQIVVQAGADNVLVDGFYIAAAAAGYENADLNLANPLTNKVISGFTILRNKLFSTLVLQQLAQAGVTTLQPVSGGGLVVWGITTSQSGYVEESEISIVFIRDRVSKVLRAGFSGFIGTPSEVNTASSLNATGVILLNSLVAQGLITAYQNLNVVQDTVNPTQWDVSVQVQPVYPINFIYIKITLGQLASS